MHTDEPCRWISDDGAWIWEPTTDRWQRRAPSRPPPSEDGPAPAWSEASISPLLPGDPGLADDGDNSTPASVPQLRTSWPTGPPTVTPPRSRAPNPPPAARLHRASQLSHRCPAKPSSLTVPASAPRSGSSSSTTQPLKGPPPVPPVPSLPAGALRPRSITGHRGPGPASSPSRLALSS